MKQIFATLTASMLFIFGITLFSAPQITKTSSMVCYSSVIISVFDKANLTPIKNANILIIETNENYQTNSLGSSGKITLPYHQKEKISSSIKDKPWNEYTLLVTKNGYLPHLHFNLKIEKDKIKTGVVISLTEIQNEPNSTFTTSYELPPTTYIEDIIKKHTK